MIISIANILAIQIKQQSDPIYGSNGPMGCIDNENSDFMDEDQKLTAKFNKMIPGNYDLDEDQHPDT